MSNLQTTVFWEDLHDKHWDNYVLDCGLAGTRPKFKDFVVWAEEHDLVPEMDYEND